MKNTIYLLLLALTSCSVYTSKTTTIAGVAIPEVTAPNLNSGQMTYFNVVTVDESRIPTQYELSVIHFILKNTRELNIHRMRGENDNQVYLKKDGQSEAVFDKDGNPVTNYNKASYNYYPYFKQPIKHFNYDILPWLELGTIRNDPTSIQERLLAYTLDLSHGIQSYIFSENEELPEISFESLSKREQDTYRLFAHILFNDSYQSKLDLQNKSTLKQSAKDYWEYFDQIQDLLKVKQ